MDNCLVLKYNSLLLSADTRVAGRVLQVAVKVQRPRVLASVGLDLYVMRKVAAAIQRLPSVSRVQAQAQCHAGRL